MPHPCSQAESRILCAVSGAVALTTAHPLPTARDRLCDALGYRLYRMLVTGLVQA